MKPTTNKAKEKIAVSACLLGVACRYDAKSKKHEAVCRYLEDKEVFLICPEVMGGLTIPRKPCELQNGHAINEQGEDMTIYYQKGAEEVEALMKREGIELALLKSKSPSCGHGFIYDGTFTKTLVEGDGICAKWLLKHGFKVISSAEFED